MKTPKAEFLKEMFKDLKEKYPTMYEMMISEKVWEEIGRLGYHPTDRAETDNQEQKESEDI